jgi:alkanesulfonate monooxygenase
MPVEFVGMIGTRPASELDGPTSDLIGGTIDADFTRRFACAHEDAGFDQVLIGYSSGSADGFGIASFCAAHTERLKFMVAHRPGFVAPTLAARKFATLDQFSQGRVTINLITGGSDGEQQRDGDWIDKETRYRRTDEYLAIMKRVWSSDTPFDHEGEFYRVKDASSEVRPYNGHHIPIYFGGASGFAVKVAAKHADVYMMWGEPLAQIRDRMAEVCAETAAVERPAPRFSLSTRPIIASTETAAWEKAQRFLARIQEVRGQASSGRWSDAEAVGSQRLLQAADKGDILDRNLWTPIAKATGAGGNTTALVGTPEQVAESLLDYYDAGVTTFLIRGFNVLQDAVDYGREIIPLVRAEVARRDQEARELTTAR